MSKTEGDNAFGENWQYPFNHENRGKVLIFNHMEYKSSNMTPRYESICDANMLVETFKKLGFAEEDILIYHGIRPVVDPESLIAKANDADSIQEREVAFQKVLEQKVLKQKNFSKENIKFYKGCRLEVELTKARTLQIIENVLKDEKYHNNADCFACVVLSHGSEDASSTVRQGVVYCYDGPLHIELLMRPLRDDVCSPLRGKPKLFFIQACRGDALDDGVLVKETLDSNTVSKGATQKVTLNKVPERHIPAFNNFVTAYSTPPGYFAFKRKNGSFFVQSLCAMFNEHCDNGMDLIKMLTRASNHMAKVFTSITDIPEKNIGNPAMHNKKQVPVIVSKLTKLVIFSTREV